MLQPREVLAALAQGPDPERAAMRAEGVLAAASERDAARVARLARERPRELARVLAALCGVAPFFAAVLRRRPELLFALAEDDLAKPRGQAELAAELTARLADCDTSALPDVLRRFKYDALARITLREASADLVPEAAVAETLGELSALAEVLLSAAFDAASRALAEQLGVPIWRGADSSSVPLAICALGLGKLGGGELNYSSDVDLIYVHASAPPAAEPLAHGPGELAPAEYFTRLAQSFRKLVEEVTVEGFLYRIDLDLRPEGEWSAIVCSSDFLTSYYDGWAATWEKAAFMKARPIAGDLTLGWRALRAIDPMIYRSAIDLAGIGAIREMKARVEKQRASGDGFDVKTGAGGIRDVEFVAQALQLLHGGRTPQVRGRSAPGALRALAEVSAITPAMQGELTSAYQFLRRVENRLQMENEQQLHVVPSGGAARERLARSLSAEPDALARFDARLAEETRRVRAHFEALVAEAQDERVAVLFARAVPRLFARPEMRHPLEALAARFASALAGSADPERAMNNLARFVEALAGRASYFELLIDRPELVLRLVNLFASSRYLSGIVAAAPGLIEPIFADPDKLLLTRGALDGALASLVVEREATGLAREEAELAALRLFQQRELVNIGLLDLAAKTSDAEVERALSDVAEVCVDGALALASAKAARSGRTPAGEFLVVGLGKLGSRELGYGSDLDVIFLYEAASDDAEARDGCVRLAQKLCWALQTRTADGICYEVDARLRPSGNQGMLVTGIAGFASYHAESAQLWERQALLRARAVAGSAALAQRFEALRREILLRPLPEGAAAEVHRIRLRMEHELAREREGVRNLKTGRGGLLDVEAVVQLLQLRHGGAHPKLHEPRPLPELLDEIEATRLLAPAQIAVLRDGWRFLQRLASRLRIVENRSISDLRADRTDLDSVARALGYGVSQRTGASRLPLLEDYDRHTQAIRAVYDGVFG